MANDYSDYTHIKVYLSDVLIELDETRDALMRGLLRINPDATEESAKHLIGVAQGMHKAIEKLKVTFGAV